jgi:hypothetical protein
MAANPLVQIARGVHKVSDEVTEYHLRSAAQMHTGLRIELPYHSKLEAVIIEDDQMVVKYTKYRATILARETRYDAAWVVADVYTRDAGIWSRTDRFEADDVRFRPHAVHEAATEHRDERQQRERRIFEADCYRPGGGRSPLDNADRTAEGYTTKAMERHWQ